VFAGADQAANRPNPALRLHGRIVFNRFKQDGEIRIIDLANRQIQSVPFGGGRAERSMPMFTADGKQVVYAEGARKDMDLEAGSRSCCEPFSRSCRLFVSDRPIARSRTLARVSLNEATSRARRWGLPHNSAAERQSNQTLSEIMLHV
jgi:hypothetical protein